jgi:predicted AlkP superfamily pyrophosphatase or phosphodiesterase
MTRFIMVALDGLRPDMVNAVAAPHLFALSANGTHFAHARSIFPSETRVATPSLITGCRPGGHGLVANTLFDASVAPDRLLTVDNQAERAATIRMRKRHWGWTVGRA